MKICAVQYRAIIGDVGTNLLRHLDFISEAANKGAELVFFPELSLTGYEPQLAGNLAMSADDARLDRLQQCADAYQIVIGVGLPLGAADGVQIGMVWFSPGAPRRTYAKQLLHSDETPFFIPGRDALILNLGGHLLAPAICFESLQPVHAEAAANMGANIYLASVAKPARAVERAFRHYSEIARRHVMEVLMANSLGPSDNFVGAGQSAAWNRHGELVAQLDGDAEGTIVLDAKRLK